MQNAWMCYKVGMQNLATGPWLGKSGWPLAVQKLPQGFIGTVQFAQYKSHANVGCCHDIATLYGCLQ